MRLRGVLVDHLLDCREDLHFGAEPVLFQTHILIPLMRVRMISPNRELQRQVDLHTRTDSPSRHIGEKLLSRRLDASCSEKSLYSAQNFPRLAHGQSQNRSAPCNTVTPVDIPITVEPVHELSDSHGEEPPGENPLRVADLKEYKAFTVKDVNDILAE